MATATLTNHQNHQQVAILNAAYGGTAAFSLAGTDTTVNDVWFAMEPGTFAERDAKQTLRIGSADI
jgi:hypothetical protein